jgi:hypothetical protein
MGQIQPIYLCDELESCLTCHYTNMSFATEVVRFAVASSRCGGPYQPRR